MKKRIFILVLLLQFSITFAQNNLANMKFEEAQEAYASNDYELTLSKLKEVRTLLKVTNEKIMHLQVMAQSQIIKLNPLENFELIQKTKPLAAKYLKDYEKTASAVNFKEVYKVDSYLSEFPNTKEEFGVKSKAVQAKKQEEENKLKQNDQVFMDFNYFPDYQLGLTPEEMLKRYKGLKNYKDQMLMQRKWSYYTPSFSIKNNKINGYSASLDVSTGVYSGSAERTNELCEKHLKYFSEKFKFEPKVEESQQNSAEFNISSTTYTWKKNNKTFTLIKMNSYDKKNLYSGNIFIGSTDENLSN